MGIQLEVRIEDLPESWEVEVRTEVVEDPHCQWDCPTCGGVGCPLEIKRLWVKFPESGWARSYVEDALVIDNKNVNHQFRRELEQNGVPYVRG